MWIIYALASALCYAAAAMFSKYSISKAVRDQKGIVVIHGIAALLLITLLWLAKGSPNLASTHDIGLAMLGGAIISVNAAFYFKAFNLEDASVVTILSQINVPMTVVAGVIVLHDKVGTLQLLAAATIVTGVIIASWSRRGFHLRNTKTIPILLIATGLTTIVFVISKSVITHSDTIAYTFYQTLGYTIFSALVTLTHAPTRRGFVKNMSPVYFKMLAVITGAEALYTLAILAQLKGFMYVNAGLVISVGASQVFLAIILGMILTKLAPQIINEKIDKRTLKRKFMAGLLIVSGIILLNFVS